MMRMRHPVGIVGAGPIGLVLAARLASFGVPSVLFESDPELRKQGSKACLIQGDALEVLDKVGCAQEIDDEGVTWRVGHTYVRNKEIRCDVYPHRVGFGPFVNISQYRIEQVLLARVEADPLSELRWSHQITSLIQDESGVNVTAQTPDGERKIRFNYLIACDGVRSGLREAVGVNWTGYTHKDRFLITDIRAKLPLTKERHFHYDPVFNPGRQLVMHPQPDDVWRIDWQLPPDADIEAERASGEFDQRIRKVIGDIPYEIDWVSTYRFYQRVVDRFTVGRVMFAGDAAHALPPYGSRGMNSGIQDADNLAWKLSLVLAGKAGAGLLETYHVERHAAAEENLGVTEATIQFMVPPNALRRWSRSLLLAGSRRLRFVGSRVNSGRMAEPFSYRHSPIVDSSGGHPLAGVFAPDCEVQTSAGRRRIRQLFGRGFVVLLAAQDAEQARRFANAALPTTSLVPADVVVVLPKASVRDQLDGLTVVHEGTGTFRAEYRVQAPTWFLVRPDGHVAAVGEATSPEKVGEALARATNADSNDLNDNYLRRGQA